MARHAFWPAPHPVLHGESIDQIAVERAIEDGAGALGGFTLLATIPAQDPYGSWVTNYIDYSALVDGYWYRAVYLESGQAKGQSVPWPAEPVYEITPQYLIDNLQGLPLNFVDAKFFQSWIEFAIEAFEAETGMLLSVQTATQEIHPSRVFEKILGSVGGSRIRLRRRPVVSVDEVYYRVRGAMTSVRDILWDGLDVQIEQNTHPDGYNPGVITIYPRVTNTTFYAGTLVHESRLRGAINVLFTYTHGFAKWPRGVKELILRYAGADLMEVAGQAETAGLSSRSIDGYSESFTASATTTTLSAMRMYYKDEIKRLSAKWKKPIFM
jgi:hypothetical protein